jgi:hypothetical protein
MKARRTRVVVEVEVLLLVLLAVPLTAWEPAAESGAPFPFLPLDWGQGRSRGELREDKEAAFRGRHPGPGLQINSPVQVLNVLLEPRETQLQVRED